MKEIVLIILISHFSYNQVTAKEPEDEHDVSSEGSAGYALRSRTDGNYVHSRSDVSSEGSAGYALTSRADESYVDSRSDADKPIMPNIGYLFMGYDIISGNPMPTESIVDPGFREKIFKASYAHERETDDRRYTIPDHIDLNSEVACQIDFTSETIETEKEYQKDLLAHVAVSATGSYGVVTGSFSASTDYSKMSNKFQSNSNVLVKSEAVCLIYKAFIQSNNPPRLTRNFKRAVKRLAAGSLGCVAFFESFGTHYLKQVDFGSRYAKVQEISKSKKEDLDEEGIDINVAASVSVGQSYGAEVEVGLKTSKKNRESYSEAVESTTEVSIGSVPPSDGNRNTWIQASKTEPLPIYYRLGSIVELFSEVYMRKLGIDIGAVKTEVKECLKGYCKDVESKHPGVECEGPPLGCGGGNKCSVNAICKDKGDTYDCECKPGYEGDGKICRRKLKWKLEQKISQPDTKGPWGTWGNWVHCPNGLLAYGFYMRVEGDVSGDDTSVNAVCLKCTVGSGNEICSHYGPWGVWKTEKLCPKECFLSGWKQRVEPPQGLGDDTALNNVEYKCRRRNNWSVCPTGNTMIGEGTEWGDWSRWKECPQGQFICGINTRLEPRGGDDTALNDIQHQCCSLK